MASLKNGINCIAARICLYRPTSKVAMPVLMSQKEKPLFNQPVRFRFANWQMLKDYKKRQTIKEEYTERLRINAIRRNTILPKELREIADEEVKGLPLNSSIVRVRQRCVVTSRPRGVLRRWRLSRIMWRHLADYNQLSGITRSCW